MTEVISSNFSELLPSIIQAIDESCFLAIDTEFSAIETFPSSAQTIQQYYEQRSNFVKQITVFQFGLAIFSHTSEKQKYHVNIYNFYLNPSSIHPLDVKYLVLSSSIKFLSDHHFNFNKCFHSGISFLNQTQEKILLEQHKSISNYRFSINEQEFLNVLLENINQWIVSAYVGDRMQYEVIVDDKELLNDYLIHLEIRRCFKTVWSCTKLIENKKTLVIECITKETYEERMKDNSCNMEEFQSFMHSLVGFTSLVRYIRDQYEKPIIGHNCFLDWLIIYDKFLDNIPSKFDEFQMTLRNKFSSSIFDTKYLALKMKEYLFARQNRSNSSSYIDNLTTLTSLSSLYDLLTSKHYDSLIFYKPIVEIHSPHRYKHRSWKHEAGYDAYMTGVVFLKLIYLYKQKQQHKIDFTDHQALFDLCLNDIQIYKNRLYSVCNSYVSLNPSDTDKNFKRKLEHCLVVETRNNDKIDVSDIISNFNSYCSMEYEIDPGLNRIYLLFQSEHCQRQILKDYANHPSYKVEKFNWLKHSSLVKYSIGLSIVMTGICILLLVKR